ncbi:DUF5316 family protein [Oceanobacillus senegalensis]|uniref:DUF5316 family protein n=1 Tax=Oceanobacillus senegalensis TaxID=1936063 RepID=UPI000A30E904|nr:DUF5316 family protein [Oceanobacillus senegalensis]
MVIFLLGIGLVAVIIRVLFRGVLLSGPEHRVNFYTETKEDHHRRGSVMTMIGIFALPTLVAAAFLLLL